MINCVPVIQHERPTQFKRMELASRCCQGFGIEIGASAHNPFHLPGAKNVDIVSDDPMSIEYKYHQKWINQQVEMCGAYARVDIPAYAHRIPLADETQDYVIHSHVFEHLPNPLAGLLEWHRLLKPGGILFMVIPKPGSHPDDVGRKIDTWIDVSIAYEMDYTHDTIPSTRHNFAHNWGGHYFVYNPASVVEILAAMNTRFQSDWTVLHVEETDSKVGNGFTVVAQKGRRPDVS